MSKPLRVLLGLAVSAFFLWLAFRNFDLALLRDSLSKLDVKWMFLALLVVLLIHFLRSCRWAALISQIKPVTPVSLFPILMFGFMVNNFLPGRAGELAKSIAAGKKYEIPSASVLGTVALERMGDLVGLLSILLVAVRVFEPAQRAFSSVVLALVLGIPLCWLGLKSLPKLKHHARHAPWIEKIFSFIEHLLDGFRSLKSGRTVAQVASLSILIWWGEALGLLLIARSLGLYLSGSQSAATLSGISVGVMIPASPGFVGTYEFFGTQALRVLGFDQAPSLIFIGILHVFQIAVCTLLGLPYLFMMGSKKMESSQP